MRVMRTEEEIKELLMKLNERLEDELDNSTDNPVVQWAEIKVLRGQIIVLEDVLEDLEVS